MLTNPAVPERQGMGGGPTARYGGEVKEPWDVSVEVGADEEGQRLDLLLSRHLPISRGEARRLLADGRVDLNGRPLNGRAKGRALSCGDRVLVHGFTPPEAQVPAPEAAVPLALAATGKDWLIVNKPAGVPVHPLRPGERGTVLNAVAARYPQVVGVGEGGLRSGIVHRLDVETSGALLVALSRERWESLRLAFRQRRIRKVYRAIVHGELRGGRGETMDLVVARHRPAHVRVVGGGDRPARSGTRRCSLRWRAMASGPAASLIEVELQTGFLHQIRVMMAHLGHPLVADEAYGGCSWAGADRPLLHAVLLEAGEVRGRCAPPRDFQAAEERVYAEAVPTH